MLGLPYELFGKPCVGRAFFRCRPPIVLLYRYLPAWTLILCLAFKHCQQHMPSCILGVSHNHFSYFINLPIPNHHFPYTDTHSVPTPHFSQDFSQALASYSLLIHVSSLLSGPAPNSLLGKRPLLLPLMESFSIPQNTTDSLSQHLCFPFFENVLRLGSSSWLGFILSIIRQSTWVGSLVPLTFIFLLPWPNIPSSGVVFTIFCFGLNPEEDKAKEPGKFFS